MEKRLYHILTPVPPEELRNANCLLVGAISIPQCVLKSQVGAAPGAARQPAVHERGAAPSCLSRAPSRGPHSGSPLTRPRCWGGGCAHWACVHVSTSSLCFRFSVGSRGPSRTSRRIIISGFLEHQGKSEPEKLRRQGKRNHAPKLNSIENQTDVWNKGGKLTVSSPASAAWRARAAGPGALTSWCFLPT